MEKIGVGKKSGSALDIGQISIHPRRTSNHKLKTNGFPIRSGMTLGVWIPGHAFVNPTFANTSTFII